MALSERLPACRFGDFVLDARAFRLTRNGEVVKLEPKAFDVLLCLLQRPGQVVSRHTLVAEAWKGIAITDNAVARVVANLRRALDDHPDRPTYIETVPTRGYRFICPVVTKDLGDEDDGEGDRPDEAPSPGPGAVPPQRGKIPQLAAIAFLVLAVALALLSAAWVKGREAAAAPTPNGPDSAKAAYLRTLAVLPLENHSGDPSQDYFAEGVTQALCDRYSEMGALGVISWTSSSRYRDRQLAAARIGSELGADMLLEGAVVRDRGSVRVSVSLVDGGSGQRLWSRHYDRAISDLLRLYDDIAANVAGDAKVAVDAVNAMRRTRRQIHPEAYDEYLRAMASLGNRWMAGGCSDAEPRLLRAVEHDADFAPAYAALAWCYAYPARLGRRYSEVGPKARAAVSRALALDDRLALAHLVAGTLKWRLDYDAAGGEAELRRARELDSSSGLVLMPSAEIQLFRGQVDQGLPLLERAIRLDPFSPDRNVQVGFSLLMAGRYKEGVERFRRALTLDPQYGNARYWLAEGLAYAGEREEAVSEYLRWLDAGGAWARAPGVRRRLEEASARGGWSAFWREELSVALEEASRPESDSSSQFFYKLARPWFMARRYARLARWTEALDALDLAVAERDHLVATMPVEPLFVPLRTNARFQALLVKTGAAAVVSATAPRQQ